MQDASKFARHAQRLRVTSNDVNEALKVRNVEVIS